MLAAADPGLVCCREIVHAQPTSARDRRNLLSRQKALDSVAHRADALLEGLHVAPTPESARHLNSDPWVRATASPGVDLNVPAGQRTADQELYTQKLIGAVPRTRRSTPQPSARDSSNGGRVVIHGAKSGLGTSRDMDTGSGTPQSSHAPHNSGSSREAKPTASPSQFARSDTGAGASSKQPFVSYKQLADSLNHAVCGLLEVCSGLGMAGKQKRYPLSFGFRNSPILLSCW